MRRTYTPALVALALEVHPKWLDNVLSHHAVPGVAGGRQGRTRAIAPSAVLTLAVALLLMRDLGAPIARALQAAASLVAGRREGDASQREAPSATASGVTEMALGPELRLRLDLAAVERRLARRLVEASEGWGPRRRGRPPGRRPAPRPEVEQGIERSVELPPVASATDGTPGGAEGDDDADRRRGDHGPTA
jgi:hypothetical protein